MFRVTVIGATVVDLIFELPSSVADLAAQQGYWRLGLGEKIRGRSHLSVGGTGANVAVGLSRLGLNVTFQTPLSKDALGRLLEQRLKEEGVRLIEQKMSGSPPLSVILPTQADRTIITDNQTSQDFPIGQWPEDGWLHLGSLAPESADIYLQVVNHLMKSGQPLSLNPSQEMFLAKPRPFRLALAKTTALFLNRQEGLALTGSPRAVSSRDLARAILRFGPKIICLTDGAQPAQVVTREESLSAKALTPPGRCVDATGAGDAFTSGFLGELIRAQRLIFNRALLIQALRLAMANSGSVVLSLGAQAGLLNYRQAPEQGKLVRIEDDD